MLKKNYFGATSPFQMHLSNELHRLDKVYSWMLFEKCLKWIDLFYMKLNILYSRAVFQSNCQATLKLTLKNVAKKEKKTTNYAHFHQLVWNYTTRLQKGYLSEVIGNARLQQSRSRVCKLETKQDVCRPPINLKDNQSPCPSSTWQRKQLLLIISEWKQLISHAS